MRELARRLFQWRKIGVLVVAAALATIVVFVIESTRTSRIRAENQDENYRNLESRVDALINENQDLTVDKEKATAQANTSVDQLVKSGEQPIIAAPEIVSVPTVAPGVPAPTITTLTPSTAPRAGPPSVVEQPPATAPPVATTSPPAVTEPPPVVTEPPPTTEPPPITEPPTTTLAPDVTTTTTTMGVPE